MARKRKKPTRAKRTARRRRSTSDAFAAVRPILARWGVWRIVPEIRDVVQLWATRRQVGAHHLAIRYLYELGDLVYDELQQLQPPTAPAPSEPTKQKRNRYRPGAEVFGRGRVAAKKV